MLLVGMRGQRKSAPEFEDRMCAFASRSGALDGLDEREGILCPDYQACGQKSVAADGPAFARRLARSSARQTCPSRKPERTRSGGVYRPALRGDDRSWGSARSCCFTVAKAPANFSFILAAVVAVLGFMMPNIWLDRKIKARRKEITRSHYPTRSTCSRFRCESGLGFDPALQRVAEKWDNSLTREFARVLSEMRIGKTKRDALREMALRADEDGLTTFVSSVIQADTLGVPITQVLRIQSEAMRVRRRQRAEEMAQKAPAQDAVPDGVPDLPGVLCRDPGTGGAADHPRI